MAIVTIAQGVACVDGLVLSSFVGSYTVTEQVPSGYVVDAPGAVPTVAVTTEASCGGTPYTGQSVSYSNTPKTNITVTVDSQVPGGIKTVITCQSAAPATIGSANIPATSPANGDGSLTVNDLLPGVYTCTINIDP